MMAILFWSLLLLVAFTYVGFPLLIWALARFFRKTIRQVAAYCPRVSLIISAYNEEESIAKTLKNVARFDYPHSHLEVLVA